jgi:dTDP-glucose pyrophosphorylase/CBS domain-containing protein
MVDVEKLLVSPDSSIRQVMAVIDRGARGIALMVDADRRLAGTVTDGDIRRLILSGVDLDQPVAQAQARKAGSPYAEPVTAPLGTERGELVRRMQEHHVRQIPLLDEQGRVAGLVTLDELLPAEIMPLQAIIMAGGQGARLRPLTEDLPKPMLPVGDRPLMQLIIEQLQRAGIRRVNVTTHYLADKITGYFGDGEAFGVELNYVTEVRPLGTAGAIGLLEAPDEPLLVINGDILTRVDFRALLDYHREHRADLTMAVRRYDMQVPYGVVECEGPDVRRLREKPDVSFLVNAGIYLLEPSVYAYVRNGEHLDMTELIQTLLDDGRRVVSFPIVEYWLDIGQILDYERAQEDVRSGKVGG